MEIPNNIPTGEMSVILRAKAACKKFNKNERSILRSAAHMIEYMQQAMKEHQDKHQDKN